MTSVAPMRILMVCMGNICRSPTAEGVLRLKLQRAGLQGRVEVDSAGTHAYHVGAPPDERAQARAALRGYALGALRARQVDDRDFAAFDLLLAMDWDNLSLLEARCPLPYRRKLRRLSGFAGPSAQPVVPDPYYGGEAAFDEVLDLVEAACDGLVAHVGACLQNCPPLMKGTS